MSLKLGSNNLPHILLPMQRPQKPLQLQQLRILRIVKPTLNGNAIVNLIPKGVGAVVDEDGTTEVTTEDG